MAASADALEFYRGYGVHTDPGEFDHLYEGLPASLEGLRDLAEYKGRTMAFQQQLNEIREPYRKRSALMRRLREAGLI